MYDLAWVCSQGRLWGELDKALVRRLAVLKVWTDSNGIHAGNAAWGPAHAKSALDPERWLRPRGSKEFDMEDIGALAVPIPKPEELSDRVRIGFAFLAELDSQEEQLAQILSPRPRPGDQAPGGASRGKVRRGNPLLTGATRWRVSLDAEDAADHRLGELTYRPNPAGRSR
ncbi:hypothetical protein [Adlercreutzia sp. ZJ242]|uniref:hypothetical protein n=1 Tax=Adlercreutzia sp. ZJ242 TaxID=2709409 RepID=UPI00197E5044|nr:hypothetical protein [Adlercreutzia sp. ZJ242]